METLRHLRPLGHVRPKERVLRICDSPKGQRSFHDKLKWAAITTTRAPYVLVAKRLRVPKAHGRVRQQAARSQVLSNDRKNKQVLETMDSSAMAKDEIQTAPIRGRLRAFRQVLRRSHGIKAGDLLPPRRPRHAHPPDEGAPHSDTGK